MKKYFSLLLFLFCISCSRNQEKKISPVGSDNRRKEIAVTAVLKASLTNFSDPRDRNYYYLVEVKLSNGTNTDCEFYTLTCRSLVNIITDSQQVNFLYHNCSDDIPVLISLKPGQEFSIEVVLVRYQYLSNFNPNIRFGFVFCKPKTGIGKLIHSETTDLISELRLMRQKQENIIWSEPVALTATNFNPYVIRNFIKDSTQRN